MERSKEIYSIINKILHFFVFYQLIFQSKLRIFFVKEKQNKKKEILSFLYKKRKTGSGKISVIKRMKRNLAGKKSYKDICNMSQ